jgi:hypothetical protein
MLTGIKAGYKKKKRGDVGTAWRKQRSDKFRSSVARVFI